MEKQNTFNKLFNDYFNRVLRLCNGYFKGDSALALDAAQEVFMRVWEALDTFKGNSSYSTWIYRITVNTCLLYLRGRNRRKEQVTTVFPSIAADQYSQDEEDRLVRMYQCIQLLSEKDRVIILMFLEGIDYKEIAEIVGINYDALRVRMHRIKTTLTNCVKDGDL